LKGPPQKHTAGTLRAGHLAGFSKRSHENRTFHVEHMSRPVKSVLMDNQVFHMEHGTHFAQKSEPLT
jgi:hypothetical protein